MGRIMQVLLAYAKYCLAKGVAGLVEPGSWKEKKEHIFLLRHLTHLFNCRFMISNQASKKKMGPFSAFSVS